MFFRRALIVACVLSSILFVEARAQQPRHSHKNGPQPKLDPKKQFVVDVVRSAVTVPQSDPMDRLRVLAAASGVIMAVQPSMAREFSREGLRIEQEAIQQGEVPSTSMLIAGSVDCSAVASLVANVPPDRVDVAESTLIAAVDRCPKLGQVAMRLISSGLEKRAVAPRLTLAMIQRQGVTSEWSGATLDAMFGSLPPPDTPRSASESIDLASVYAEIADDLSTADTSRFGVQLLSWLSRVRSGKARNLAVNIVTGKMRERLGDEQFNKAIEADAGAMQASNTAGQAGDIERPEEETASVLKAMQSSTRDRTDELEQMRPSLRAREAAASGFALGTEGNVRQAEHYFDIAFRAVEEAWRQRDSQTDVADLVAEVSEAAAHVSATKALQRSQRLQEPAAQAISMIAIARVVANSD